MPSRGGGQKRLSFPTATPARLSHKRKRSLIPSPPPLLHLPSSPPSSPHSPALPRSIHHVHLGCWQLDSWHHSPYLADYQTEQLWVCERCLRYTRSAATMKQHEASAESACDGRPTGRRVYDDTAHGVAVYEVNGGGSDTDVLYCQCLCLLSKLFIQHKTVYYDVNPFLFYILMLTTPTDSDDGSDGSGGGERLAAYFSKEKTTTEHNNLACIVTLPHMQQKGYGRFLIQLSYQLTLYAARTHGRRPTGGPERPLSELAVITYTSYWCDEVGRMLGSGRVGTFVSLRDMAESTAIERSDLIAALQALCVECSEREGEMGVRVSQDVKQRMARRVDEEEAKRVQRGDITFDTDCLRLDGGEEEQEEEQAETNDEVDGAEGEGEAGREVESDEESGDEQVVVKKVRRKGGKRRSVVVTTHKSNKPNIAVKRTAKADYDEECEEQGSSDEDEAAADE